MRGRAKPLRTGLMREVVAKGFEWWGGRCGKMAVASVQRQGACEQQGSRAGVQE